MNDFKPMQEEFITILLLLIALTFASSNLSPELLEDDYISRRLPKVAVIN